MLIQANTDIVVTILNLKHICNIDGNIVACVKMLSFLELIMVLCMFITKKDILVIGKDPTQGLNEITITAKAKYSINFTIPGRRFCVKSAL